MTPEDIDDTKPEQVSFEFLLRHVDDEPTIADYRFLQKAAAGITETALGFAVVGEVEGATKLLETLQTRGIDPFGVLGEKYPFLKPCIYFAWEATSSWPAWIPNEDRAEGKLQQLETKGRALWLERFGEEWTVSEDTAKTALDMAYHGVVTVLPDYNGTLAGQVNQAELMWKNGQFTSAANPNGPITVRYAKRAMWWRQGAYPFPYVQVYRTAGLMVALDIYLRLEKDDEAEKLFQKICERFHFEDTNPTHSRSPRDSRSKTQARSHPSLADGRALFGTRTKTSVQERECRETGPHHQRKHFSKLPFSVLAAYRPPNNPQPQPEGPDGLLHPPCSPSDIAALEKRLGVALPQDYREFLSVTNGLGSRWNGQNLVDYLVKAEDVCWQDIDSLEGNPIPLLRDGDPLGWASNGLNWPEVGHFRVICLSGDQSSEESNGHLFLLDQEMVQERKDYFFKVYEERNEPQRSELERVVEETYGSMENFRNLEYALISWTAWDIVFYPYNGVRDLLERMAEAGLYRDRPWLNIFEPRFRRLT